MVAVPWTKFSTEAAGAVATRPCVLLYTMYLVYYSCAGITRMLYGKVTNRVDNHGVALELSRNIT